MTKHIDHRKNRIIRQIMQMNDESALEELENQLQNMQPEADLRERILRPTREKISLEQMIEEQNYIPIEREEFFELATAIGIEESLEELLAQLDRETA